MNTVQLSLPLKKLGETFQNLSLAFTKLNGIYATTGKTSSSP